MVFNERKRADARNGKGLRVAVAALTAVATLAGGGASIRQSVTRRV